MFKEIVLNVNGMLYKIIVKNNQTLAEVLREKLGLLGTKIGCDEGECGACTVIMNGRTVTSCLILAVQADGEEIITIEGITDRNKLYYTVKKAFVECGAIQCGFCTPGMILSTVSLLNQNPEPSDEEIKEGLSGNLCRCTGYIQIFEAVKLAVNRLKEENKKNV